MNAALKMTSIPPIAASAEGALHFLSSQGFVQYHPVLADKLGSFKAALFLGHALYWARHVATRYQSRDGWFFLSARQCSQATGLSPREQVSARQLLIEHSLIAEMVSGRPAKLHYRVDLDRIAQFLGMSLVDQTTSWQQLLPLFNGCVSFYRPLADIAGNVASGLYLSYLLVQQRHFMSYPRQGAGFSVSQQAIRNALCLGPKTQRNARERLKQIGLLKEYGSLVQINLQALCALLQCQDVKRLNQKSKPSTPPPIGAGTRSSPDLALGPHRSGESKSVPTFANSRRLFGFSSISQNQLFDLRTTGSVQAQTPPAPVSSSLHGAADLAQALIVNALRRPAGLKPGRLFGAGRDNQGHGGEHLAGMLQPAMPSLLSSACQTVAENAKLEMPLVAQNAIHPAENAKLACPKRKTNLPKTQNIKTANASNTTTNSGDTVFDEAVDKSKASGVGDDACRRRDESSLTPKPQKQVAASKQGGVPSSTQPPAVYSNGASLQGLVMPEVLAAQWHDAVRHVLSKAKPEHRQPLLDELEGQLSNPAKNINNPPGYLHALRIGLELGAVQLAYADSVATKRREQAQTVKAMQQHAQHREAQIKATTPVMSREEALAKLRKQAQELRSARK